MSSAVTKEASYYSSWPVIVHRNLMNAAISKLLIQKQMKLRTSSQLAEGTVIFPKAKVAFLLLELTTKVLDELLDTRSDQSPSSTFSRIDKFDSLYGKPFVILQAPLYSSRELSALAVLQTKYLGEKVDFVISHDGEESVTAMLTIADLQTPPMSDALHERWVALTEMLLTPGTTPGYASDELE